MNYDCGCEETKSAPYHIRVVSLGDGDEKVVVVVAVVGVGVVAVSRKWFVLLLS